MILTSETRPGIAARQGHGPTLDALFRRAADARPTAIALADPPNRIAIDGQSPQRLSYREADAAIDGIAAALTDLHLQADDIVAIALPNVTDSIIAILAVLRAGLIAAPVPLLFGRGVAAEALSRVGAKALISCARIGDADQGMEALALAGQVFTIRHVCAIRRDGPALPDGMVSLDPNILALSFPQREGAAAHVAVITWETGKHGIVPVARNHAELIAGGLAVMLECPVQQAATHLTTLPATSFGGLATGLMPWLLGGGTLVLHHGFAPDAFEEQCDTERPFLLTLPGPAAHLLAEMPFLASESGIRAAIAAWQAPERLPREGALAGFSGALVDVQIFGEIGLVAGRRDPDGLPPGIPFGLVTAPRQRKSEATPVIELMPSINRTLTLRGPMVPVASFRPGGLPGLKSALDIRPNGFVDTGYPCGRDGSGAMILTGPPAGLATIGGHRCRVADAAQRVAATAPGTALLALPDSLLGHRLALETADRPAALRALADAGEDPLILAALAD